MAKSSSAFGQRPLMTLINDISPKTFCASFFHHPESVYKVGRHADQGVLRYPVRKYVQPESHRKVDH